MEGTLLSLRRSLRYALLDRPLFWRCIEALWPFTRVLPFSVKLHLDRQLLQRLPKDEVRAMLLRCMPENGVCAEVGVWKGDFSDKILRLSRPRELHLIDPWIFQPQYPKRMYGGNIASSQADMDEVFESVRRRFAHAREVRIHRRYSRELLDVLKGITLDWAYIDGNHSKKFVDQDLDLIWRCLRNGGYITGDDYFWRDLDGSCGVREAVDEFAAKRGLRVELVGGQYLLRKP